MTTVPCGLEPFPDMPIHSYEPICSEDDRDTWLAARAHGIGASEVAALLGEDPYTTREELIALKRGEVEGFAGNRATRMGHHLEPWILQEYAEEHGVVAVRWAWMLRSTITPHLYATPDGCEEDGLVLLQVKSTSQNWKTTKKYGGSPPLHVQIQVQAELAVTGYDHDRVLALHLPSRELYVWTYEPHEGLIDRIRNEVETAWEKEIAPCLKR